MINVIGKAAVTVLDMMEKVIEPLVWEDTREVDFNDAVVFGDGYVFERWTRSREEADTYDGRFAVWKCPVHGWSYYGGNLGWHKGGFANEAEAKDAVRTHQMRVALAVFREACGGVK